MKETKMKRIAVILSGSGVFDGAEIHESVLALYAIEKNGAKWHCFAPNVDQLHVVNHFTGEVTTEKRNVLVEAARIARGHIQDVAELNVDDFDALLVPGGFGAAKNLSDFAINGANCTINPAVLQACQQFAHAHKPAGYLCIAPVLIPLIYGEGVKTTIGTDPDTANAVTTMGGEHIDAAVDEVVFDPQHNVFSTPAYMLANGICDAAKGIEKLVGKLVESA